MTRHDYLPFGEEIGTGTGGRTTGQRYRGVDKVRQQFTGQERKFAAAEALVDGKTPEPTANAAGEVLARPALMYVSYPPPGRSIDTQLEIQRKGAGFTIKYADEVRCAVTYKVLLQDAKISGEYFIANCDHAKWRRKGGKFLAVRSSTARDAREP